MFNDLLKSFLSLVPRDNWISVSAIFGSKCGSFVLNVVSSHNLVSQKQIDEISSRFDDLCEVFDVTIRLLSQFKGSCLSLSLISGCGLFGHVFSSLLPYIFIAQESEVSLTIEGNPNIIKCLKRTSDFVRASTVLNIHPLQIIPISYPVVGGYITGFISSIDLATSANFKTNQVECFSLWYNNELICDRNLELQISSIYNQFVHNQFLNCILVHLNYCNNIICSQSFKQNLAEIIRETLESCQSDRPFFLPIIQNTDEVCNELLEKELVGEFGDFLLLSSKNFISLLTWKSAITAMVEKKEFFQMIRLEHPLPLQILLHKLSRLPLQITEKVTQHINQSELFEIQNNSLTSILLPQSITTSFNDLLELPVFILQHKYQVISGYSDWLKTIFSKDEIIPLLKEGNVNCKHLVSMRRILTLLDR
ncbi:hypothetical protein RCL1_004967 [Eukaryota sp. TZLM3-RCL]